MTNEIEDETAKKARFDKEIYDQITEIFTKHGFQYRDSPAGYDKLTFVRSGMEGALHGIATKEYFVRSLVEVIEAVVDDMNKMRRNEHVQE